MAPEAGEGRAVPDFNLEKASGGRVAGVDEAGRGPLAGPVVAAAVILPNGPLLPALVEHLDDSKRLVPKTRLFLYDVIRRTARIGIGAASVTEIDRLNILQASLLAMSRAVAALADRPDVALIDGNQAPRLACSVQCIIEGDRRSLSIAAASVIAKVTRDRLMTKLARGFPGYGWDRNAGYGTPEHLAALDCLGPTRHHRHSFQPVAARAAIRAQSVTLPVVGRR